MSVSSTWLNIAANKIKNTLQTYNSEHHQQTADCDTSNIIPLKTNPVTDVSPVYEKSGMLYEDSVTWMVPQNTVGKESRTDIFIEYYKIPTIYRVYTRSKIFDTTEQYYYYYY